MTDRQFWDEELQYCESQLFGTDSPIAREYWALRVAAARAGLRLHDKTGLCVMRVERIDWQQPLQITVVASAGSYRIEDLARDD